MPHGSLTPLGRQLRSVLANLRPNHTCGLPSSRKLGRWTLVDSTSYDARKSFHTTKRAPIQNAYRTFQSVATTTATVTAAAEEHDGLHEAYRPFAHEEVANGIDSKAESDLPDGHDPEPAYEKLRMKRIYHDRMHREDGDVYDRGYLKSATDTNDHRFMRILKNCVRHLESSKDTGEADWMVPFELQPGEQELLDSRGYVVNNFK